MSAYGVKTGREKDINVILITYVAVARFLTGTTQEERVYLAKGSEGYRSGQLHFWWQEFEIDEEKGSSSWNCQVPPIVAHFC